MHAHAYNFLISTPNPHLWVKHRKDSMLASTECSNLQSGLCIMHVLEKYLFTDIAGRGKVKAVRDNAE